MLFRSQAPQNHLLSLALTPEWLIPAVAMFAIGLLGIFLPPLEWALLPSGAMFGAWEAKLLNGIGLHGETGSLSWNDLRSTDPDTARTFYAAIFGYHYAPVEMAGPDYSTFSLDEGGAPAGGIGGMMGMDGYSSHWIVYLAVPDVDEAVRRTPELEIGRAHV